MLRAQIRSRRPARIKGPDHCQRGARQSAAADADGGAIGHQCRCLIERHDLFTQAAVALARPAAKFVVGGDSILFSGTPRCRDAAAMHASAPKRANAGEQHQFMPTRESSELQEIHFARVKVACPVLSSITNMTGTLRTGESSHTVYRVSPSRMYLRVAIGAPPITAVVGAPPLTRTCSRAPVSGRRIVVDLIKSGTQGPAGWTLTAVVKVPCGEVMTKRSPRTSPLVSTLPSAFFGDGVKRYQAISLPALCSTGIHSVNRDAEHPGVDVLARLDLAAAIAERLDGTSVRAEFAHHRMRHPVNELKRSRCSRASGGDRTAETNDNCDSQHLSHRL